MRHVRPGHWPLRIRTHRRYPHAPCPVARPVALVTGSARRIGAAIARTLHARRLRPRAALPQLARRGRRRWRRNSKRARAGSTLLLQADLAEFDRLPELVAHTRRPLRPPRRAGQQRLDVHADADRHDDAGAVGRSCSPATRARRSSSRRPPHRTCARRAARSSTWPTSTPSVRCASTRVYCMAKAALLMMTRSLALELAPGRARQRGRRPGAILWPEDGGERRRAAGDARAHAAGAHRHAGGSRRSGALAAAGCALQHRPGAAPGWRAAARRVMLP